MQVEGAALKELYQQNSPPPSQKAVKIRSDCEVATIDLNMSYINFREAARLTVRFRQQSIRCFAIYDLNWV